MQVRVYFSSAKQVDELLQFIEITIEKLRLVTQEHTPNLLRIICHGQFPELRNK
jgi:hypothetical protein